MSRGHQTAYGAGRSSLANEVQAGRAHRCVVFKCKHAFLVYRKAGDRHNSGNGDFTVSAPGWYCPTCGGGYGGSP